MMKMSSPVSVKKIISMSGHNAAIYALCEGWEENTIISGSGDKHIAQWNILTGKQDKFSAVFPAPVFSLMFLENLNQIWVGTANGHLHVIDTKIKKEIHDFNYHQKFIYDLKFEVKLNRIYSVGGDGILNIYDPYNLKHIHSAKLSNEKIRSLLITKDKIFLAEGSGKSIVLNANDFSSITEFQSHQLATNCYYYDEENQQLISGGRDAMIKVWDIENNFSLIQSIPAHKFAIYRMVEITETELMATASRDKTIKIWNKKNRSPILRINKENFDGHAYSVNALIWHRQAKKLISAGDDKQIFVWEISNTK